jgi:DNA repair protein RecN (Recombination protein N)
MLKSLHISNYALIDELNITFDSGFSVITGETGAGKSIIIGALSLILGQRADTKAIKQGEEKCIVESEFDVSAYNLKTFFDENDLDFDEKHCVIRREINSQGKSRAFVNDTPTSLNVLRELSERLIDIHSQHENLELGKDDFQREVVDNIAQNEAVMLQYKTAFEGWKYFVVETEKLKKLAENQTADLDYMKFQWQQLVDFQLVEDEQEELEQELETLNHAEEIKAELNHSNNLLINNEITILSQLKESLSAFEKIKNYVSDGEGLAERLESAYIELKDIAQEINRLEEKTDINPARLEYVETRLSELYSLQKKFGLRTVSELMEKRNDLEAILQKIELFDEEILKLEKETAAALKTLEENGKQLTKSRVNISKSIEETIVAELAELGIPAAQVKIDIAALPDFTENGRDNIVFLFSANKNREPLPVSQVASGGEISRLMLAIKSLLADKAALPTIIFDEIDVGVSGDIADRMGKIMEKMSRTMQVFAITHLPQIAARGNHHFRVFKIDDNQHVSTKIELLAPENRVTEIAQMLSGSTVTDAAVQNAKILLGK